MPKYKAAAYIRLSYTDDHSSESDSVSNQRKLIENFVERKLLSIAEWTDRALALSSPKKLTSSASFSPSIRISLRLKNPSSAS